MDALCAFFQQPSYGVLVKHTKSEDIDRICEDHLRELRESPILRHAQLTTGWISQSINFYNLATYKEVVVFLRQKLA